MVEFEGHGVPPHAELVEQAAENQRDEEREDEADKVVIGATPVRDVHLP